jgi:hypothetical protein
MSAVVEELRVVVQHDVPAGGNIQTHLDGGANGELGNALWAAIIAGQRRDTHDKRMLLGHDDSCPEVRGIVIATYGPIKSFREGNYFLRRAVLSPVRVRRRCSTSSLRAADLRTFASIACTANTTVV